MRYQSRHHRKHSQFTFEGTDYVVNDYALREGNDYSFRQAFPPPYQVNVEPLGVLTPQEKIRDANHLSEAEERTTLFYCAYPEKISCFINLQEENRIDWRLVQSQIRGGSLHLEIQMATQTSARLKCFLAAAQALYRLHQRFIVHRDPHFGNVLIQGEVATYIDLGSSLIIGNVIYNYQSLSLSNKQRLTLYKILTNKQTDLREKIEILDQLHSSKTFIIREAPEIFSRRNAEFYRPNFSQDVYYFSSIILWTSKELNLELPVNLVYLCNQIRNTPPKKRPRLTDLIILLEEEITKTEYIEILDELTQQNKAQITRLLLPSPDQKIRIKLIHELLQLQSLEQPGVLNLLCNSQFQRLARIAYQYNKISDLCKYIRLCVKKILYAPFEGLAGDLLNSLYQLTLYKYHFLREEQHFRRSDAQNKVLLFLYLHNVSEEWIPLIMEHAENREDFHAYVLACTQISNFQNNDERSYFLTEDLPTTLPEDDTLSELIKVNHYLRKLVLLLQTNLHFINHKTIQALKNDSRFLAKALCVYFNFSRIQIHPADETEQPDKLFAAISSRIDRYENPKSGSMKMANGVLYRRLLT